MEKGNEPLIPRVPRRFASSGKKQQKSEETEEDKDERRKRNYSLLLLLLLLLLVVGSIVAFSIAIPVLHSQQNDALRQQADSNAMQFELLRQELAMLNMNSAGANITVTGSGTFLWSMGNTDSERPAPVCIPPFNNYASVIVISSAGSGYAIGDLVVLMPTGLLGVSGVVRVTAVGGLGELTTMQVLTPGCCSGSGLVSQAISNGGGSGAQFTITCDTPVFFDTAAVYSYPAPSNRPVAAPRVATYRVLNVALGGVSFSVLELSGPAEGAAGPFRATYGNAVSVLEIDAYNFQPVPSEMYLLAEYNAGFPLTLQNRAALDFRDSSNCLAAGTCFQQGENGFQPTTRNAVEFSASTHGSVFGPFFATHQAISMYYVEVGQAGTIDFVANQATFSLRAPLHFVLPAL